MEKHMGKVKIGKITMSQESWDKFRSWGKLLNQEEVAEMLDVSPRTMEFWRCHGFGPKFVRISRLVKYREVDVLEYIESLTD